MLIQWSLGRRSYRLGLALYGPHSPKLLTIGLLISESARPPRFYGIIVWRQRQTATATNKTGAAYAAL